MQQYLDRLTDKKSQHFADQIGDVFKTIPHLPQGLVEFFVKVAPYLALLGAILSLVAGPILGLLSVMSLITLNPLIVLATVLAAILSLVNAVLLFMAFNPLKDRQYRGWMLLFWSQILGLVETVVMIVLGQSSILSIVMGLIALYVLYEMRPFYKSTARVAEVVDAV